MGSSREGARGASAFMMQNLRTLHGMFCPDGLRGDTLRGIGCGPTIHQLLHACKHCQEIITSDYTEQNCRELEEGLKNEAGAFHWEPVVKYVCELKGDREKWAEKQEKLRKVKQKTPPN